MLVVLVAFLAVTCHASSNNLTSQELDELAVGIEFTEYDFEDYCASRSDIYWKFYHGSSNNLSELIAEETSRAKLYQKEAGGKINLKDSNIPNNRTRRLLDIIFTSGEVLLQEPIFNEFITFATDAETASALPKKSLTHQEVEQILRTSKNATTLASTWSQWTQDVQTSSRDLSQQISLLTLEAEANGAESVEKHWLARTEVKKLQYKDAERLWISIAPLYQKLHQFLATHIATTFGSQVFTNPKLIPIHLLGSLDSADWVTAAENVGALKGSQSYSRLLGALTTRKIKDMYRVADEITGELNLGYLPDSFYDNSAFEVNSPSCLHFIEETCKRDNVPRVLHCKSDPPSVSSFMRAHEEVAHIKHHAFAADDTLENGFLTRKGPKDSVLYEAISLATSLLAIHPENLRKRELLQPLPADTNVTSLLLTALHIIPPLPLHLSYDLWRLQALKADEIEETPEPDTTTAEPMSTLSEDTDTQSDSTDNETETVSESETAAFNSSTPEPITQYGRDNLTADWWSVRGKLQGVSAPDDKLYEDYLQDHLVVWNKPHLSKFLGPILLFQILDNFKDGNTTENLHTLQVLLTRGKSRPWEEIIEEMFNITELNTEPLLNYFKPLEKFLDEGAKFQNTSSTGFSENDFNLFLKSSSVNDSDKKDVQSAGEGSNAVLIILVAIAVIGSAAAIFSVIRSKVQKRRKAKARKRYSGYN